MSDDKKDKYQAESSWFHFFRDMIKNGDMAKLSGSSIKVYLVIKSHVNYEKGGAFPGEELIAKESGLSKRQVIISLKELEAEKYITKTKSGKHNVYSLREKVEIKDADGKSQAVATWDYIPNGVKGAMAELKNAVMTGDLIGGKIIHIENLNLQMNIANDNATQVVFNADIEKLPSDMQEKLVALKQTLEKKTH